MKFRKKFIKDRFIKKSVFSLIFIVALAKADMAFSDDLEIQARVGAFFPSDHTYKEIYGTCNMTYQLEMSRNYNSCSDIWLNLELMRKEGSSFHLRDSTRITQLNLSMGLKYPYAITDDLYAYGGVGGVLGGVFVRNHINASNDSEFYNSSARNSECKLSYGIVAKTGLKYFIKCNLIIDLFLDYQYQLVQFETSRNIGGFKTGLGLGYVF